ncbi:MAG: helix-turn-helix transcriptional regulator [Proteobacteria bacterium]|nr:helix-turn-helix transcriptional regulator [Pseudomonadota bacterium]
MTSHDDAYLDRASTQLRESRQRAGLSLRALARRAGTSHATLIAYEKGTKVPSVTTFMRIIGACGLDIDFVTSRRVRHQDGLARGEELAAVLRLAEQFPASVSRQMNYPVFPHA